MGASNAALNVTSSENDRPVVRDTDQMVENILAEIAKVLWRENTAPNLAVELGCEVRSVERYFEGTRTWSGDAVAIIVAEILKRHSMRNVKIKSR